VNLARDTGARQVVRFSAVEGEFAVDVTAAVEVMTADRIAPLPDPAPGVVGVVQRRGIAVPVIAMFGSRPGPDGRHVLIVDRGASLVGLLVGRVHAVTTVDARRLSPAPGGQHGALVEAVMVEPGGMIMLIDPRHLPVGGPA
jgi:purine-binding chemotaxis protein CheW